ncbi:MAG: NAD(P)H-binding protein [Pseudonocardiaceae bacterium]|nr:NAD(P)H-binding protein [Pseudonocardiaceae bacterium]
MKILLIGATGVLGRPAVAELLAQRHDVKALARNEDRAIVIRHLRAQPVVGDLFDTESLRSAMTGCDAVINLASRLPQGARFASPAAWRYNDHVRVAGSAAVVDAALHSDTVHTVVAEGICFVYADGGDAVLDEDAPLEATGFLRSSVLAHENAQGFAATGRTAVRLRIGLVVDRQLSQTLLGTAKLHLPMLPGPHDGWRTLIRPIDAAAAAIAALRAPSGVYNVGADPIRVGDLAGVVGEAAGVRRARTVPPWLVPAFSALAPLTRSLRVSSARLSAATDWRPRQPRVEPQWFQ